MSIEVRCPSCQALLRIADENVGRKSRCPNCSNVFTAEVPPPAAPEQPPVPPYSGASPFSEPLSEADSAGTARAGMESSANPYAPTYSEPEPMPASGEFAPRLISLDEVISKSWLIFKKHWVMVCVAILIVGAINFVCNLAQNAIGSGINLAVNEPLVTVAAQAVFYLVFWIVGIWIQLGQTMVMLDVARGRQIDMSKLFGGGPFLVNGVLAMLLMMLILSAVVIVLVGIPAGLGLLIAQSGEGAGVGAFVGGILAIVPFVVILLSFSQVQPLIVDRRLGAVEALRVSYEITNGNKFTLFLLGVILMAVTFGAFIVGLLMLCIGVFPAMIAAGGFGALVLAVAYLAMTSQRIVVPGSVMDPSSSQFSSPIP